MKLDRVNDAPNEWPIDGTLDLHLFKPGEVGDLVPEYLAECGRCGMRQVRIIHGKGTGQLRERVHAVLRRIPAVASFSLAPGAMGGWGATVVELRH
jgi:dsDNA-specific endonuclease/ATPase MutS2